MFHGPYIFCLRYAPRQSSLRVITGHGVAGKVKGRAHLHQRVAPSEAHPLTDQGYATPGDNVVALVWDNIRR